MEGLCKISHKGKEIIYSDYSNFNTDKEKALQLVKSTTDEYVKHPQKSILALVNVSNLRFDMDIINAFKSTKEATDTYIKKTAIFGMKGLQQVAYNFVVSLTQKDITKTFDSELEAKEWLVNN